MKKEKHPEFRDVLFVDSSNGHTFICGSTVSTGETQVHEGKEYPVVRMPVTSASHPFFTGSDGLVDAEGRIEKFKNRYKAASLKAAAVKDQSQEHKQTKLQIKK